MVSGTVRCAPGSRDALTASGAGSELVWTRETEVAALVFEEPALKPNYSYCPWFP